MDKFRFFFSMYESLQTSPTLLNWIHCPKLIPIQPENFIYMGELITLKGIQQISHKANYVLTSDTLIECADITFRNPISAIATLPLCSPNLKKTEKHSLKL